MNKKKTSATSKIKKAGSPKKPAPKTALKAKAAATAKAKSVTAQAEAPIVEKGLLAIDTDGTGDHHKDKWAKDETSAMWDKDGKLVFKFTKAGKKNPAGVKYMNADTDDYAVAPASLADVDGGPLSVGDRATVELPNGKTYSAPIGDFGPPKKFGEFSLSAVKHMGVDIIYSKDGPIPTLDGKAASDINVTVTYYPGTAA